MSIVWCLFTKNWVNGRFITNSTFNQVGRIIFVWILSKFFKFCIKSLRLAFKTYMLICLINGKCFTILELLNKKRQVEWSSVSLNPVYESKNLLHDISKNAYWVDSFSLPLLPLMFHATMHFRQSNIFAFLLARYEIQFLCLKYFGPRVTRV